MKIYKRESIVATAAKHRPVKYSNGILNYINIILFLVRFDFCYTRQHDERLGVASLAILLLRLVEESRVLIFIYKQDICIERHEFIYIYVYTLMYRNALKRRLSLSALHVVYKSCELVMWEGLSEAPPHDVCIICILCLHRIVSPSYCRTVRISAAEQRCNNIIIITFWICYSCTTCTRSITRTRHTFPFVSFFTKTASVHCLHTDKGDSAPAVTIIITNNNAQQILPWTVVIVTTSHYPWTARAGITGISVVYIRDCKQLLMYSHTFTYYV